jgi:hypothetical protein
MYMTQSRLTDSFDRQRVGNPEVFLGQQIADEREEVSHRHMSCNRDEHTSLDHESKGRVDGNVALITRCHRCSVSKLKCHKRDRLTELRPKVFACQSD